MPAVSGEAPLAPLSYSELRGYLRENDIKAGSENFPSYTALGNITRPSPLRRLPGRHRYQWDLVSHLSLNYSSITQLDMLQRMLRLYDWTDDEQNQRRIDGIRQVEVMPVEGLQRGALLRGMEIRLLLHEDHYRSRADIHLFGHVLHHFFSMYASVNSFVQTRIQCHPSNKVMTWEPLPGARSRL
jgi:type VI secretion system protein ImpG